jgi:hypothetical protein
MKKLILLLIILTLCVPAFCGDYNNALLVYKVVVHEKMFQRAEESCPVKKPLSEIMWLVLEVDIDAAQKLECGDVEELYGYVINDAIMFKRWTYRGQRYYDNEIYPNYFEAHIVKHHAVVRMGFCDVQCITEGVMGRNNFPSFMHGYGLIDGQYIGEANINIRYAPGLTNLARRKEWSKYDIMDYLTDRQPRKAMHGDGCDPFNPYLDS